MLEGLDDLAWGGLLHAYGSADDLPGLIRAAASTDEAEADGAVEGLFSSVFHQGTVYPASAAVVPFVAELVAAGATQQRWSLLHLLGGMADPHEAAGVDVAAVRAALTAQAPRLLPLLADPDPRVRETAAYALAQCPEAEAPVSARLRERLAVEDAPLVRASLLAAGARLDAAGWAGRLSAALDDASPAVRAAAALAIARAGLPWPGRGTAAVVEAYRDGDPLEGWVWTGGDDTLSELLERFDDVGAVPAAVLGALAGAATVEARWRAAYAIGALSLARRSAAARLLPLLGPQLADADDGIREAAARTVRVSGAAGALVADELAALAAGCADGDEAEPWEPAAQALRALIRLGDPRWRRPLLTAWRSGRVPDGAGEALREAGVAADAELLAAVRARLARSGESAATAHSERAELALLVGSWGAAAAPAVPELLAVLGHGSAAASAALAAIGPAASAALPALRAAAGQGDLEAAAAVWRLAPSPARCSAPSGGRSTARWSGSRPSPGSSTSAGTRGRCCPGSGGS